MMETLQRCIVQRMIYFRATRSIKNKPYCHARKTLLTRAFDLCDMFMNASAEVKLSAHSFGQKEKVHQSQRIIAP